jgi:hypothetical protein
VASAPEYHGRERARETSSHDCDVGFAHVCRPATIGREVNKARLRWA